MHVFVNTPKPCEIIKGRLARHNLYAASTPEEDTNAVGVQEQMYELGFIRASDKFRKHACPVCTSCQPSRVNVANFTSRKRLRDLQRMNADLEIRIDTDADVIRQHFKLSKRFKDHRFPGQENDVEKHGFAALYFNKAAGNEIWGLYKDGKLVCGIIFNRTPNALSSTQYYYDPAEMHRSLGMYATYLLIVDAIKTQRKYVYMGPATTEPSPYQYKSKLSGIEVLTRDGWQPLRRDVVDQARPSDPACK